MTFGDRRRPVLVSAARWCRIVLLVGTIGQLARLQLSARRRGWSIRVLDLSDDLAALLVLVGLEHELTGGGTDVAGHVREADGPSA
jgi:hypothetical protein